MRLLVKPTHRKKNNIKMYLIAVECERGHELNSSGSELGVEVSSCEQAKGGSNSVKDR
jgi:hypothetical protein